MSSKHSSRHGRANDAVSIFSGRSQKSGRSIAPSIVSRTGPSRSHNRSHSKRHHEDYAASDNLIDHVQGSQHGRSHKAQLQLHRDSHRRNDLHSEGREMVIYDPCTCGTNLYSQMLGPTADESVLVGLQTFMELLSHKSHFGKHSQSHHGVATPYAKHEKNREHQSKHDVKKYHHSEHHRSHHSGHTSHHSGYKSHHSGHKSHQSGHGSRNSEYKSDHSSVSHGKKI